MSAPPDGIEVVPASPEHEPAILDLLATTLGRVGSAREVEFFRWKHTRNPFGRSPGWVAVDGVDVVAFRTFLRWEFRHGDRRVRAARAVDTATRSDYQGRGLFTTLTLVALEALRADGVDFIFNTPNDQSRPGYLKMGWHVVGRLPTVLRPTSVRTVRKLVGARRPAERWSCASSSGVPAAEALSDGPVIDRLLDSLPDVAGLRTRRSVDYLRWRYGWQELQYRALSASSDPAEGLALFRIRRRGPAVEASLCELLVPDGQLAVARHLVGQVARAAEVDHVIALSPPSVGAGLLPVPRIGPILTWRGLAMATAPARSEWSLSLGDVELF